MIRLFSIFRPATPKDVEVRETLFVQKEQKRWGVDDQRGEMVMVMGEARWLGSVQGGDCTYRNLEEEMRKRKRTAWTDADLMKRR